MINIAKIKNWKVSRFLTLEIRSRFNKGKCY